MKISLRFCLWLRPRILIRLAKEERFINGSLWRRNLIIRYRNAFFFFARTFEITRAPNISRQKAGEGRGPYV